MQQNYSSRRLKNIKNNRSLSSSTKLKSNDPNLITVPSELRQKIQNIRKECHDLKKKIDSNENNNLLSPAKKDRLKLKLERQENILKRLQKDIP